MLAFGRPIDLWVAAPVAGSVLVVVFLFHVFRRLYIDAGDLADEVERRRAQNDVRTTAFQVLGGAIAPGTRLVTSGST